MNITTLLASFNLKIPVIVSERTNPKFHNLPFFYQKLRKIFYPKAAKIIVQTTSAANYFEGFPNIEVIPNFVRSFHSVKQNFFALPRNLISMGRLCPFKGFDTLIYAFHNLLTKHPKTKLTIYGEGPERKPLEELIFYLKLQNKAFLPGNLKDISSALKAADLFVFPSLYEGFPNALSEAMAAGLPVVASNCSGNIDLIEDHVNGRLFPVGDEKALAQILFELFEDGAQRKRLSAGALKITEQFSMPLILEKWERVFKSISLSH